MHGVKIVMRLAVCAGVLLALAAPAAAQPLAWSVQVRNVGFPVTANQLVVFNFATGVDEFQFTIPPA